MESHKDTGARWLFVAASATGVIVSGCILPRVALQETSDGPDRPSSSARRDVGIDAGAQRAPAGAVAPSEQRAAVSDIPGAPPVMLAAGSASDGQGGTSGSTGGVAGLPGATSGRQASTSMSAGGAGIGDQSAPSGMLPAADAPSTPTIPPLELAFANWPMPDALEGSQTKPSYSTTETTVTDNVTHLVWQRNAPPIYEGCTAQSKGNDSVPGDSCTWTEANQYCKSASVAAALGGSGWRLPTKIELESIMDETRYNPAIDTTVFQMPTSTPTSTSYWTASPNVHLPADWVWVMDFKEGHVGSLQSFAESRVRCVR